MVIKFGKHVYGFVPRVVEHKKVALYNGRISQICLSVLLCIPFPTYSTLIERISKSWRKKRRNKAQVCIKRLSVQKKLIYHRQLKRFLSFLTPEISRRLGSPDISVNDCCNVSMFTEILRVLRVIQATTKAFITPPAAIKHRCKYCRLKKLFEI